MLESVTLCYSTTGFRVTSNKTGSHYIIEINRGIDAYTLNLVNKWLSIADTKNGNKATNVYLNSRGGYELIGIENRSYVP